MTLSQVEKRLAALERSVTALREQLEYERTVEGIRRGLESADRGEGITLRKAFATLRKKHRVSRSK